MILHDETNVAADERVDRGSHVPRSRQSGGREHGGDPVVVREVGRVHDVRGTVFGVDLDGDPERESVRILAAGTPIERDERRLDDGAVLDVWRDRSWWQEHHWRRLAVVDGSIPLFRSGPV